MTQELIERYLLGQMPEEERMAFEQRLAEEPDLRQKLDFQRLVLDVIKEGRRQELKTYIRDNAAKPQKRAGGWMKAYTVAASLAVAACLTIFIYFNFNSRSGAKAGQEAYSPKTDKEIDEQKSESETKKDYDERLRGGKVFADNGNTPPGEPTIKYTPLKEEANEKPDEDLSPAIGNVRTDDLVADNSIKDDVLLKDTVIALEQAFAFTDEEVSYNTYAPKAESFKAKKSLNKELSKSPASPAAGNYKNNNDIVPIYETDSVSNYRNKAEEKIEVSAANNRSLKDRIVAPIKVQIWKSSINYVGYRLFRNELQLYGIPSGEKIRLIEQNNGLYLFVADVLYPLKEQNAYNNLEPVLDTRTRQNVLGNEGRTIPTYKYSSPGQAIPEQKPAKQTKKSKTKLNTY